MSKNTPKEETRFLMVKKHHKKTFFEALKKGQVDQQVISLCSFFAASKNYFTSSTCSGRIVLLKVNKNESKQEAAFAAKWHEKVKLETIWKKLAEKTLFETWFKQEPFILHIGCRNLDCATELLQIAKDCGIKRAAISVPKKGKFLLEIIGTQSIAFPVKKEKNILIEKEKFKYILKRANQKLEKNYRQLAIFEKECKKKLK